MFESSVSVTASRVSTRRFWVSLVLAIAALLGAAGCIFPAGDGGARGNGKAPPSSNILVLAASDLKKAFTEIGKELREEKGVETTFSFGSTGQLAQQVEAGARADVFAAANVEFVDELREKGLTARGTQKLYATGRLVIWTRKDAPRHPRRLQELTVPGVKRIAIANPAHAPYGKAAKEAMESVGVWDEVSDKVVFGENATQTMQFGRSGNVDAAIVPLSLATGSGGVWEPVPARLHRPLRQSIAVLARAQDKEAARAFVDFVTGPKGRRILEKYGFELP